MPPSSRRRPASATATSQCQPKKTKQGPFNLQRTTELIKKGLEVNHDGKRLLLAASGLYRYDQVPEGEENYFFQYHIHLINEDCNTAIIEFDERYVEEDGDRFFNYPNPDPNTTSLLTTYSLERADDDHERFNVYLGRENKRINDQREAEERQAEAQIVAQSTDLSDINKKMQESTCDAYTLLVNEFKPEGDLLTHTVAKGPHVGKTNYKQMWTHKFSGYEFMWHRKPGKTDFQRDRLYKAARQIIAEQRDGYARLKRIMAFGRKAVSADDANAVYAQEEDMLNRVYAVAASVWSQSALSIFDNVGTRQYIKKLDSKHTPPHRVERVRLAEVMVDGTFLEFSQIVKVSTFLFHLNVHYESLFV